MTRQEKMPKKHKRVWLWIVTPFLFLAVGAGAYFGIKYYFENVSNNSSTNEIANNDEAEEDSEKEERTAEIEERGDGRPPFFLPFYRSPLACSSHTAA